MNTITFAMIGLRSLSMLFALQGRARESDALGFIATSLGAGTNVDAHMERVAAALDSGQQADWDAVTASIEADSARLQSA